MTRKDEDRRTAEQAADLLDVISGLGGGVEATPLREQAYDLAIAVREAGRVTRRYARQIAELCTAVDATWAAHGITVRLGEHLIRVASESTGGASVMRAQSALAYVRSTGYPLLVALPV